MSGYTVWLPIVRMDGNLRRSISFAGKPGLAGRSTVYTVSQLTYYYDDYDDDEVARRHPAESRLKRWARKLGFKKSHDNSEQSESQSHVLRGEFVLREQPLSDFISERNHGRLKFRQAPLSFSRLDEIEKDPEDRGKTGNNDAQQSYANGILPICPAIGESDPDGARGQRRQAPSPPRHPEGRSTAAADRRPVSVDKNHNRREDGEVQNGGRPERNVASLAESLERLSVNEPCFVGAFRKDEDLGEDKAATTTKRQAPLPPPPSGKPVPPPRKKKDRRRKKHKVKLTVVNLRKEDGADVDGLDVDEVMAKLRDLYAGDANGSTVSAIGSGAAIGQYMQWPSERERPPPAEPPRDYSPERTTPATPTSAETHYSSPGTSTSTLTSAPSGLVQAGHGSTPSITIMADYEEVTTVLPPPPPPPLPPPPPSSTSSATLPPPLSGLRVHDEIERRPSVPLASDLITQRSQLRKTRGPNRKSRARTRSERRRPCGATSKRGARVGEIGEALEEKGILDPYLDRIWARSSSFDDVYQRLAGYDSGASSGSPPTSPRERSPASRFTYLPNGVLTKPALKRVPGGGVGGTGRPPTRRHTVSFQTPTDGRTNDAHSEPRPQRGDDQEETSARRGYGGWHDATSPVVQPPRRQTATSGRHETRHSLAPDLNNDDYNKLQATLRVHLEKPRELPKVNMRAVRQYEKEPDPPSELELFFKKRRQKMALENPETNSPDVNSRDPEAVQHEGS